nr:c-type cytochrome biogenesis protein CcsB [Lachnospiraceae bacterium]
MDPVLTKVENIAFMAALIAYLVSAALYFIYAVSKRPWASKAAYAVLLAAFVLQTVSIAARGIHAGRLPLTNQYEFASAFAWGIALCFLIFVRKYRFDVLGTFIAPVIFLIIGYASMQSREIHELMPALQSSWLGFHVSMAIIGYGAFGVAFGVALAYLVRDTFPGSLKGIPEEKTLDLIIYRAVALGFLFLTLCMITGAIWAKRAWGSYWSWDPKETWSLITWLIYAIFLHLRLRKGMTGRKAAVFAVIGFLCVIFTYVGVNTLIAGLHSYK